MALACKICILKHGLKGSQLSSLPQSPDQLEEHLESEHHIPVMRQGETKEQAIARFLKIYPEAKDCEDCRARSAPWVNKEG